MKELKLSDGELIVSAELDSGGEIEMENLYGVSSTRLDLNDAVLLVDHLTKVFMLDQLSREER